MQAFEEEIVSVKSGALDIVGTLSIPNEIENPPVVLIIAGSGPTNRDGNTWQPSSLLLENNSLKMLGEALAEKGIASLRFDKRGVDQSLNRDNFDPSNVTFNDFVDDAEVLVQALHDDHRFEAVHVLGHSEGALIGMILANRTQNIDGFISLAGGGRSILDILSEQLEKQFASLPDIANKAKNIISKLKNGNPVDDIPIELTALFNKVTQNFLMSENRYDPLHEIAEISVPISIIQGTTDIQVLVKDAELLYSANPDAELRVIDGMNHVLKTVSDDAIEQQASYNDPSLPINSELIDSIIHFIRRSNNLEPILMPEP